VWDYVLGNLDTPLEIVHSHDHNRYLSPFRSVWDPKDLFETTILCGRYISDDFGGIPLHPIDVFDTQNGSSIAEIKHPSMPTISPINLFHPTQNIIASGTSKSMYLWKPLSDDVKHMVSRLQFALADSFSQCALAQLSELYLTVRQRVFLMLKRETA